MDTTTSIFDWLDSNPDLKEFNVPLMSDRWTLRVVTNFPSFTMFYQGRRDLEGFWSDPERLFGWAGLFMACGSSEGERYIVKTDLRCSPASQPTLSSSWTARTECATTPSWTPGSK